jgi:hypothetical protein
MDGGGDKRGIRRWLREMDGLEAWKKGGFGVDGLLSFSKFLPLT